MRLIIKINSNARLVRLCNKLDKKGAFIENTSVEFTYLEW